MELDHRERAGFIRQPVRLVRDGGSVLDAFTYMASPDNSHFLGDAPLSEIVSQIARRAGPSGSNRAYVRELASALRQLNVATAVFQWAELNSAISRDGGGPGDPRLKRALRGTGDTRRSERGLPAGGVRNCVASIGPSWDNGGGVRRGHLQRSAPSNKPSRELVMLSHHTG